MKKLSMKFPNFINILVLVFIIASFLLSKDPKKQNEITAFTNVRIIDAKTKNPIENGTVIVVGNIIEAVGNKSEINIPKESRIVNLKGKTIMPGLIDVHYHATINSDVSLYDKGDPESDVLIAFKAARNLRTFLELGVTTIRDVGGVRDITYLLKKALTLKLITGPRYYHSGRIITNTGGHAWNNAEIVDGKEQIIRAIRGRFYEGLHKCDFIKVTWNLPEGYSNEEIKTAIEETHKYGKKIAIHAYQPETIQTCIEYGADTVEHGWGIAKETIPLAIKNKTIIVPTMYKISRPLYDKEYKYKGDNYKKFIQGRKKWVNMILEHLKPYVAAGGMTAMGTDWLADPITYNIPCEEFIIYKELGMNPFQIIQAGTINGAKAIGIENKTGSIEKGKWADMIVLEDNPLDDLEVLKKVKIVILDGEIVVDKR